jgi:uridine phosphorylase
MKSQNKRAGKFLPESELILNPNGSVYHLKLKPENIGDKIIVVGDQYRVQMISDQFDHLEFKVQNREFCTHTGLKNGKRVTALSTGIGVDNIDIVLNELDALINVDLEKRVVLPTTQSLEIIRIGTCGALQPEIEPGNFVCSSHGFGLDGMMNYYQLEYTKMETELLSQLVNHCNLKGFGISPYLAEANKALIDTIGHDMHQGITATASGFYAPQGRAVRLEPSLTALNDLLESFQWNNNRVVNFEMETSALFALGSSLGHKCLTTCVAVANRPLKKALTNYKPYVQELIELVLARLTH